MNRYLSSFALSIAIYVTLVATILYSINNNNREEKSKMESIKVVKISLLGLLKEAKNEVEPRQEQKSSEVKKESKKEEPVVKKEPKKIVKKVPPLEQIKSEKVALKEEVKQAEESAKMQMQTQEPVQERQSAQKTVAKTQSKKENMQKQQLAQNELEEKQKNFFLKLRELINQNKFYPNSARRRGVQGNVEVSFCILENGNVDNIELISGKSIFKNSVQEAIEKSFPMQVDKTLFSFPKEFKITLAYVLADATN